MLRIGDCWPIMKKDAMEDSQRCDACQRHKNILHQLVEPLHPIIPLCPFMRQGMDIVGKLPIAPCGKVFM